MKVDFHSALSITDITCQAASPRPVGALQVCAGNDTSLNTACSEF